MTVSELQQLLSDLGKFLRGSGSAKVAAELEHISERLILFKDYNLKAFADFLEKAEQYARDGTLSKKSAPKGKKAAPESIDRACAEVLELYNRAIDPSVTLDKIESSLAELSNLDPPMTKLKTLSERMGSTLKFKNKADAIKAIRQKLLGRKGSFDRVNA